MKKHVKIMAVFTLVLLCCIVPFANADAQDATSIEPRIAFCPFCQSSSNAYEVCGGMTYIWETAEHENGCIMTLYARDSIYGCACGWRYVVGQHRCYITHSSCGAGTEDWCQIGKPPIMP